MKDQMVTIIHLLVKYKAKKIVYYSHFKLKMIVKEPPKCIQHYTI